MSKFIAVIFSFAIIMLVAGCADNPAVTAYKPPFVVTVPYGSPGYPGGDVPYYPDDAIYYPDGTVYCPDQHFYYPYNWGTYPVCR